MINRTTAALAAILVSALGAGAQAQSITSTQVISGLSRPVYLTYAPGIFDKVFVAEQRISGGVSTNATVKMYQITPAGAYTFISNFFTVTGVSTGNEQGLLGLAFHPQYLTNGKVYAHFSNGASAGATTVREYIANGSPATATTASPSAQDVIFSVSQPFTNHNGGWLQFGPDGFLYLALGDGGSANDPGGRAQNTFDLHGKLLRFDVDGDDFPADTGRDYRIPPTNPFANGAAGAPEVYSYGIRNPWRNDIDPVTGDLYVADVGQNAWEEVDVLPLAAANGKNFGWRCLEADVLTGLCTPPPGTQPILLKYGHSSAVAPTFLTGCSLTGGVVYRGCAIPGLEGTYFFTDFCSNWIWSVKANAATNTFTDSTNRTSALVTAGVGSITSFGRDAFGEVYIISQGGNVHKIVRNGGTAPADCNGNSRPDCWEILEGSVADTNNNAVPDTCEAPFASTLIDPANGATGVAVAPTLKWSGSSNAVTYNVTVATDAGLTNVVASTTGVAATTWVVSPSLAQNTTYFWGVRGVNPNGSTASSPTSFSFTTIVPPPCPGDINGDGQRNTLDLTAFLGAFGTCPGNPNYNAGANIDTGDPCINTLDLTAFLGAFGVPCP